MRESKSYFQAIAAAMLVHAHFLGWMMLLHVKFKKSAGNRNMRKDESH